MEKLKIKYRAYTAILKLLRTKGFQYFVLFFILGSMACVILSSFELSRSQYILLFLFLWLSTIIFTIEYIIRIILAPALYPNMRAMRARFRYVTSFYGIVDFVAVIPFILIYMHWGTEKVSLIMLPYIFITFKLIRYSAAFTLIGKVLEDAKDELITAYTACGIMVCFSAILMYFIEQDAQPEKFANIGDGLWWAVVSFTTVGYGDVYPITPLGRTLSCIISLIGIGMIALPTGIISSSFMQVIQKKKDIILARKQGEDVSQDESEDSDQELTNEEAQTINEKTDDDSSNNKE